MKKDELENFLRKKFKSEKSVADILLGVETLHEEKKITALLFVSP